MIISEEKPTTLEFLSKFLIVYIIALRLQTLTLFTNIPYEITCFFIFFLINIYSFNEKRRFALTIMLILLTYSASFFLSSSYLFVIILILIIVPSIPSNSRISKFIISTCLFVIPILILFIIEKFDKERLFEKFYEKLMMKVVYFNENYTVIYGFNILKFIQERLHTQYIFEYEFLRSLLDYLIKFEY